MNKDKFYVKKGEIVVNFDYLMDKRDLIMCHIGDSLSHMKYDIMCFDNVAVLVEMDGFDINISLTPDSSFLYLDAFIHYQMDLSISKEYVDNCLSDIIIRDDSDAEFYVDDGDYVASVTTIVPVEGRNLADISRIVEEMSVDVKKVMKKAHDLGLSLKAIC